MVKYHNLSRFVYADGSKVADITHADTSEHTVTPAALGLPPNAVLLDITAERASGSGNFHILTTSSGQFKIVATNSMALWPIDNTGAFRYKLSVKSDDWDIFCFGYWIYQPERK